ncbi:MAG: hypothetical protein KC609_11755, partial [Myxococcales bacterium]|nr:hypothetical protein [Myxococcales bacterium]
MSTTAARDYLYSYIFRSEPKPALERPSELQFFSTLEDCRALLSALGNPEQKLRIVHVAGTNGKGSTCALISAALQHAGHRVGQLSSPHLSDLRERIRLGRDWIPAEALESLVDEVRPLADRIYHGDKKCFRSFGQLMLGLGLLWLSRVGAEIAVVETGYGGTYDNSNVLDPLVSVITAIGLDHKQLLGPDLLSIARHKAGIIKPGRPVAAARQTPEIEALLRQTALRQRAELRFAPSLDDLERRSCTLAGSRFQLASRPGEIEIPLVGPHQIENALLALEAAALCERELEVQGDVGQLIEGLCHAEWPGRCEIRGPAGRRARSTQELARWLSENAPLYLLDGAHNASAIERLAETL